MRLSFSYHFYEILVVPGNIGDQSEAEAEAEAEFVSRSIFVLWTMYMLMIRWEGLMVQRGFRRTRLISSNCRPLRPAV